MPDQPLIRNYGLFWKAHDVFWGAGSNPGSLLGVLSTKVTEKPVDFRSQRGIYVLYADYDLVYVGQNNGQQLLTRLKQHKKDDLSERWNRFSWFGMRAVRMDRQLAKYNQAAHVPTGNVLDHIEAILIHSAEPQLNRQGGKFGDNIDRYLQKRDERLGPSQEQMLKEIYESLVE